jgi:hypothetical protein
LHALGGRTASTRPTGDHCALNRPPKYFDQAIAHFKCAADHEGATTSDWSGSWCGLSPVRKESLESHMPPPRTSLEPSDELRVTRALRLAFTMNERPRCRSTRVREQHQIGQCRVQIHRAFTKTRQFRTVAYENHEMDGALRTLARQLLHRTRYGPPNERISLFVVARQVAGPPAELCAARVLNKGRTKARRIQSVVRESNFSFHEKLPTCSSGAARLRDLGFHEETDV